MQLFNQQLGFLKEVTVSPFPKLQFGASKDPFEGFPGDTFESVVGSLDLEGLETDVLAEEVKEMSRDRLQETLFPKSQMINSDQAYGLSQLLAEPVPGSEVPEDDDANMLHANSDFPPEVVAGDDDKEEYLAYPSGDNGLRKAVLKHLKEKPILLKHPHTLFHLCALILSDPKAILLEDPTNETVWRKYQDACETQVDAIRLLGEHADFLGSDKILNILADVMSNEDGILYQVFTSPPVVMFEDDDVSLSFEEYFEYCFSRSDFTEKELGHMAIQVMWGEMRVFEGLLEALANDNFRREDVKDLLVDHIDTVPQEDKEFMTIPLGWIRTEIIALCSTIDSRQSDSKGELEAMISGAIAELAPDLQQALDKKDAEMGDNKFMTEDDY